jgi:L-fuconolactonase
MPTLDSQVHAYERNHLGRPWIGTLYGPPEATGDQMVTAMDAAKLKLRSERRLRTPLA